MDQATSSDDDHLDGLDEELLQLQDALGLDYSFVRAPQVELAPDSTNEHVVGAIGCNLNHPALHAFAQAGGAQADCRVGSTSAALTQEWEDMHSMFEVGSALFAQL